MKKLDTWIYKIKQRFRSKLNLEGRSEDRPSDESLNGSLNQSEQSSLSGQQTEIKTGLIEKINQKYLKLPPPLDRCLKPLIIVFALIGGYAILGFFLLPAVLKAKLPDIIQEQTGRKSSIANIEFNPFKLIANINGFKILENNDQQFVGFDHFNIDINGFESITNLALVIDEITLKKPEIHLVKQKDGKFNFEDMAKPQENKEPELENSTMFPLKVAKLSITEGKFLWDDKHFSKPVADEISPINISTSDFSTETDAKAKLDFNLGLKSGGKLELKSTLGINPLVSEGSIKLDKVQLQNALAFALSDTAGFDLQGHELFNSDYKLGYEKKDLKVVFKNCRLELQNFQFTDKSTNQTVLKTPSLSLETSGNVTIAPSTTTVDITNTKINSRDFKFTQQLPEPLSVDIPTFKHELAVKVSQSKDSLNLSADKSSINIKNLKFAGLKEPISVTLPEFNHEMDLKLSQTQDGLAISTNKSKITLKNLDFSGLKEPISVSIPAFSHETDITVNKAKKSLAISANTSKIGIQNVQFLGLKNQQAAAKIADINLETGVAIGLTDKTTDIVTSKGKFDLLGMEVSEKGQAKTLIKLASISLNAINFDLLDQEVVVDSVLGKNAEILAWLDKDGSVNYQSLMASAPKVKVAKPPKNTILTAKTVDFTENAASLATVAPIEPFKPKKDWLVKVSNLALDNFSLSFEDKSQKKPVVVTAKPINFKLTNFNSKLDSKLPFQLDLGVNKTGSIKLKGESVILPLSAKVDVDVKNIDLDTFQPYVDKFAKVDIEDGKFNVKGQLDLKQAPKKPIDIKFRGDSNITDLITRDQIINKDLIKWENLTLNELNLDVLANKYTAKTLLIEKPYAKVTIRKDKTINFSDLVIEAKSSPEKSVKPDVATQKKIASTVKPIFRLGNIKIVDGSSDFADLSLILPFAAQIKSLDGGAVGITSEQKSSIKVDLKGSAYELAPVAIKGEVSPYLGNYNIDLNFEGMPMPLVTPYMVQFAGYKIEKGKLTLGLHYEVENRNLKAANNIVIDQLELGEKVDNPNAVSLPLELAITLLKDSDGKIKLDVPLTGSLEDPQFNIGHIVKDALVNVLTKIISAPFRALASLIGGSGDEDLSTVVFKPGTAQLDDKEKTKLDGVAKALKEKSKLSIEVKGAAFEEQDWPALQDDALFDQLKQRKAEQLSKKEGKKIRAEYVELSADDYNEMLADAFIEKFPNLAEKSVFGSPKLINSDAGDFYQVAKQKMEVIIKPDQERLKHLANDRSQAIAKYFVQKSGIPNGRVFLLDSVLDPKREGKEIASILSLKTN